MANIDSSEKAIAIILKRFPQIKAAAIAAGEDCKAASNAADALFKSAIKAAFRLTYLSMLISKNNAGGCFSYLAEKYTGVSRRTAYRYLQAARHLIDVCECLHGLSCEEVNAKMDDAEFVEEIFSQSRNNVPHLSLSDFYKKELPAPEEKAKKIEIGAEARAERQAVLDSENIYIDVSKITVFFIEKPPEEQLWRRLAGVRLVEMKTRLECSIAEIAKVLNDREQERRNSYEQ